MPLDRDDLFDLDDLSDEELRDLVRDELDGEDTVDAAEIDVQVHDGRVTLAGWVGTDAERRIAEHVVTDVIGVVQCTNDIAVVMLDRDIAPEAVDDELAEEAAGEGEDQLGGNDRLHEDPSAGSTREDLEAELYGTHDLGEAIAEGESWNPPDTPTPEGEERGNPLRPERPGQDAL